MACDGTELVTTSNLKAVVDRLSPRIDAGGGRTVQRGDDVRHHPAVG